MPTETRTRSGTTKTLTSTTTRRRSPPFRALPDGSAVVDAGTAGLRTAKESLPEHYGGGAGGLICPRHGADDFAFRPVGFASKTAIPASIDSTRTSQNRVGMFTSPGLASFAATSRTRRMPDRRFQPLLVTCSWIGPAGTFSGAGSREREHDQRNGVVGRLRWRREVHLRRGTGPAGDREVADHPSKPR